MEVMIELTAPPAEQLSMLNHLHMTVARCVYCMRRFSAQKSRRDVLPAVTSSLPNSNRICTLDTEEAYTCRDLKVTSASGRNRVTSSSRMSITCAIFRLLDSPNSRARRAPAFRTPSAGGRFSGGLSSEASSPALGDSWRSV
jgi:hypothetical protein